MSEEEKSEEEKINYCGVTNAKRKKQDSFQAEPSKRSEKATVEE